MASAVVGALRAVLSADTADFDKAMKGADANIRKLADSMQKQLVPSQSRVNSLVKDFLGSREIGMANAYAKAVEQIGGANKLVASDQAKVNRVVQEALQHYKALGVQAPANMQALANATKQVKAPTDDLAMSFGKLRSIAGTFGVSLGVGAVVAFGKSVVTAAGDILDASNKLGVSTDAIQRWSFAAEQTGATMDDVSRAVVQMNDRLANGEQSTVNALRDVGLKFSDIRAMKPEDAFNAIVKAISEIEDPMIRTRVALDLFGKSGQSILPAIVEGFNKVGEAAPIMANKVIKGLDTAEDRMNKFYANLKVWAGNVIVQLEKVSASRIFALGEGVGASVAGLGRTDPGNALRRGGPKGLMPSVGTLPDATKAVDAFNASIGMTAKQQLAAVDAGIKHSDTIDELAKRMSKAAIQDKINDTEAAVNRLAKSGGDFAKDELASLITSLNKWQMEGMTLPPTLDAIFRANLGVAIGAQETTKAFLAMGQAIKLIPKYPLPSSPLNLTTLLGEGVPLASGSSPSHFAGLFGSITGQLPSTVMSAITGGGNLGQSIGSLFGSQLGSRASGQFGKALQGSFLGKKIGGMVADFLPGIGALLGPALGKLFSAIGGIGANTTKGARGDFAKSMGFESLDNLYNKLRSLGAEGDKLANVGLNVIGKKDKAANEKWMKDVTAFFDRLERVPGKINELSQALGRFGGAIPDQLSPLLDSILGNPNLSADLRMQLEGMRKPSWQAAQEMAQALGINPAALGAGFNQSRLAEQAFSLKRSLDVFAKFAGSDQNAILKDMADEFSTLAAEAKRTGAALPRAIQAFLMSVDEMGMLLDENGNRIDASLLTFADIEDEYLAQAVSLLEQIRDLLTPPTSPGTTPNPNPPGFTPAPPGAPRPGPTPFDPYNPGFQMYMPNLSGASYAGAYAADTSGLAASGESMTVILERDGRAEARWLVPFIPNEVERLRLA